MGTLGVREALETERIRRSQTLEAIARVEERQLREIDSYDIHANEYKVYSQFGEDGIIQFLLRHVEVTNKFFVEIGVEEAESNTRYLLVNDLWAGLVLDADPENISKVRGSEIFWRHNLTAAQAFVTAENINDILVRFGARGDIGLLSIDIDGNDYWIWKATNVIEPAIVVIEYNAHLGPSRALTVPYEPDFSRHQAHPSGL